MTTINSRYSFDLEDKITWDEWSPSLQDKLQALWNKLHATNAYLDDRIGGIRTTIDSAPPNDPVEYNELWFDTRYMILRSYTKGNWTLTKAAWYGGAHGSVVSTPEAPLSTNPVTNCHCYAIQYTNEGYCHCKSQMWDQSTVPEGQISDIAFNKKTDTSYNTNRYQWVIEVKMYGVIVQSLNAYTDENPNTNAIIPSTEATRVQNEQGGYSKYVTFDSQYDPMFDENATSSYVFNEEKTYTIPFTFAENIKLTHIFGRLAPYSNGPVTIHLQAYTSNSWKTIATITLNGNPQYATFCHGNCHCARW